MIEGRPSAQSIRASQKARREKQACQANAHSKPALTLIQARRAETTALSRQPSQAGGCRPARLCKSQCGAKYRLLTVPYMRFHIAGVLRSRASHHRLATGNRLHDGGYTALPYLQRQASTAPIITGDASREWVRSRGFRCGRSKHSRSRAEQTRELWPGGF